MKELSVTQKVLIATGAAVVTAAAVVGAVVIAKKLKQNEKAVAVLEFDSDEDEEIQEETTEQ